MGIEFTTQITVAKEILNHVAVAGGAYFKIATLDIKSFAHHAVPFPERDRAMPDLDQPLTHFGIQRVGDHENRRVHSQQPAWPLRVQLSGGTPFGILLVELGFLVLLAGFLQSVHGERFRLGVQGWWRELAGSVAAR